MACGDRLVKEGHSNHHSNLATLGEPSTLRHPRERLGLRLS